VAPPFDTQGCGEVCARPLQPNWHQLMESCVKALGLVVPWMEFAQVLPSASVRQNTVNKTVLFTNPPSARRREMTTYLTGPENCVSGRCHSGEIALMDGGGVRNESTIRRGSGKLIKSRWCSRTALGCPSVDLNFASPIRHFLLVTNRLKTRGPNPIVRAQPDLHLPSQSLAGCVGPNAFPVDRLCGNGRLQPNPSAQTAHALLASGCALVAPHIRSALSAAHTPICTVDKPVRI